ncbi:MAG: NUDIX domain-containing protein [Candidatus Gracilibacteria bacterium]|nr:NUDIX domain-containing protein [Candidatus Gracilibacteria bacterium]
MHNEKFFITAKVRGVILHEGKIFLSKAASRSGRGGFYCLPGGTLERGEGRKEGLRREFIEELGVEPIIGDLIYTQEFVRPDGTTIFDFWYEIRNSEDFLNIDISTCSHGFEHEHVGFYDEKSIFDADVKPDHIWDLTKEWKKNSRKFIQNT